MTSDVQWQNYLSEATDSILTGEPVDALRSRYGITYKDDRDVIDLIEKLNQSLVIVEPPPQFARRLKDDLMGVERSGFVWRIRRLPARVQWAAIVTAIVGGILIVIQRFIGASNRLRKEKPAGASEES